MLLALSHSSASTMTSMHYRSIYCGWMLTWHCNFVRLMAYSGLCNRHFHAWERLALDRARVMTGWPITSRRGVVTGYRRLPIVPQRRRDTAGFGRG
jgi:hypothetical protein